MEDWCSRIERRDAAIRIGVGLFSDCGAWHGYCLSGEFIEVWALPGKVVPLRIYVGPVPGIRVRPDRLQAPGLRIGFAGGRTAVLEVERPVLAGDSDYPLHFDGKTVVADAGEARLAMRIAGAGIARTDGRCWELRGEGRPWYVEQTLDEAGPRRHSSARADDPAAAGAPGRVFLRNQERWNRWLAIPAEWPLDGEDRDLLLLAAATLIHNWRGPRGDIRHAGVVPSPFAYNGFWAWDSWKHARALALFVPDLAKDQVRAMLDHQLPGGMVPDTVMVDSRANNTANTKPPLAAWAAGGIYAQTGDAEFVEEIVPALLRYDAFWNRRRPPGEALHAYGGIGLTEAKWESGWDNATRFDAARMVPAREGLIMNVLPVDLNAFLAQDKRCLAELCALTGRDREAAALRAEASRLEELVRDRLFDPATGAFYDLSWPDGSFIPTFTAAAWAPLWTGAASPDETRRMAAHMLDPSAFWTPMPFPTVALSDPRFEPDGYWRGPVWMDQAGFAIEALDRIGRRGDATGALRAAFSFLRRHDSFYECYNPLTGAPARGPRPAVAQFSWTAAHLLLAAHALFAARDPGEPRTGAK